MSIIPQPAEPANDNAAPETDPSAQPWWFLVTRGQIAAVDKDMGFVFLLTKQGRRLELWREDYPDQFVKRREIKLPFPDLAVIQRGMRVLVREEIDAVIQANRPAGE